MAWDRRSRSLASRNSQGRGTTTAMNALESTSSLQPWACSSLSSSEKFHSFYEKMQEDRERNNLESLICSTPSIEQQPGLLQEELQQQRFPALLLSPPTLRMMTDKPGSKIVFPHSTSRGSLRMMTDKPDSRIVFPHITSRGSLVGKKVYCRTSIHTSITCRQKSSTQRMHSSLMILKYYQDRSSSSNRLLLGGEQQQHPQSSSLPAAPPDSITSVQRPDHSLGKGQCRSFFFSLAGAAGMRLICPPLQLPLLEILLFFREHLSENNKAAPLSERGRPGLWRLPVNLALATLRPFCGSLAGRCLTTLLCIAQMRIKANNNTHITTSEQHDPTSYISVPADLYSVVSKKDCNDLDRKEFTKSCSINHFQIDDSVVTMADADDVEVPATDPTGQNNNGANNNLSITLLSNVVVGSVFEEECWSDNGVQVVEVLISESEDSLEDQKTIYSGCSMDSEFSLVDLEEEDLSSHPCLKLKESKKSSSENVVAFGSRERLHVGVEEARQKSFVLSNFVVATPAFQLPWEAPSSMTTVVKKAADWSGTVSALEDSECFVAEDDAMPSADRVCLSEEEQPDPTSLSQITHDLKIFSKKRAEDHDEPCSASRECDEAAVVVESRVSTPQVLAEETVETQNQVGYGFHDGKSVRFVEGESPDELVEHEVGFCLIEEHRIDDTNCLFGRTSAENEPEKESSNNPRRHFEVEFDGDASDCVLSEKLPEQTEVFLPQMICVGNKFEKADVMVPVESVLLVLEDEESASRVLDSPIEEQGIGGRVCVSPETLPDLFELLMEANWIGASREFAKGAVLVPPKKPLSAWTSVTENQAVKNRQEGKFIPSVGEKSAVKAIDQELEVGPIKNQAVEEIQELKSEYCIEEKFGEEEHRIEVDDCEDWLESLLEEVEVFIAERADVLGEHEKAAVSEMVENQAVKDIQEVNSTCPAEGISPESVLDQELEVRPIDEYRIDDGNCVLSERLPGDTNVFLSYKRSSEIELDEKESPSASAVMVPGANLSLRSTESVEQEVVKEIHEVDTSHSIEEKPADGLLNHDLELEVGPVEEHRDWELLEMLQGECYAFLSDRTSAEIDSVKGVSAVGAVVLSVEVPSSAVTELPEDQPIKEIQEVKSLDLLEKHAERVVNQESEVSSIQGEGIGDQNCKLLDMSQVQVEVEHPESKLIYWTGEGLSEPSTQTSLTSRLNNATETVDKALDPDSGAIAVVLDDELNCDETDGYKATEAKALDEIKSGSIVADDDSQLSTVVSVSNENGNLDLASAFAGEIGGNGENNHSLETCSKSSPSPDASSTKSCGVPQRFLEDPFADHPKCVELRELRHSHGDQTYMDMQDLLPAPWGQLIFWHGRCKEGRPTLCVLLGKAVRQLPGHELKKFIEVTVSHLEYAELNFFKGNVKKMNILMDLEGIGFMRLPPMHILSAIGAVLNRDYAGRGGWIILVNAPLMLGFVISAIQGVILRPSNNKGDVIDSSFKGFLEGKERIVMMGGKYRLALQKYFDISMLPVTLGGDCSCGSDEKPCKLGNEFLKSPWDTSSHV